MIEALPTTRSMELIDKKKYVKVALDEDVEAFIVYVNFLNLDVMTIAQA